MSQEKPEDLLPFAIDNADSGYVTIDLRLYESDLNFLIDILERGGTIPHGTDCFQVSNTVCKLRGLKFREWLRREKK